MEKYFVETENGEMTEVTLTQQAYIDGVTKEDSHYKALAEDFEGCQYMLRWEIKDDWNWDDESDACNWDQPDSVTSLGMYH